MSGLINSAGSRSGVIGVTVVPEESGTFTWQMIGSGGSAGDNYAASLDPGRYVKQGRNVYFSLYGYLTHKGSYADFFIVTDLPFTNVDTKGLGRMPCILTNYPSTNVDAAWRTASIQNNSKQIRFQSGSRMDVVAPYSEVVTSYAVQISGFYFTDD